MKFLKIFFFQYLNFGDALNAYLFPKIAKCPVVLCSDPKSQDHVLGIGSIANWATTHSTIWGSGLASLSDSVMRGCNIAMIRGPLSARIAHNHGNRLVDNYGDPALVLPRFYNPKITKKYRIGIIPHYTDQECFFNYCPVLPSEYKFINVFDPVEKVIDDILSCEKIISSSLHGLIVADAYGIPNLFCKIADLIGGDGMKYKDYFLSVKIAPYNPIPFDSLRFLQIDTLYSKILQRNPIIDIDRMLNTCPFYAR